MHWWIPIVLALAGAHSADGYTTSSLIHRGGHEVESAWIVGRRPSDAVIAGYMEGEFAATSSALWFTGRSKHRWIRVTGRVVSIGLAVWHTSDAIHNTTICSHGCRR